MFTVSQAERNSKSFFQLVYGDDPPGHLVLWTRQDKQAHWLPADDLEAASPLALRLSTAFDVYCGVALQDKTAAFAKWRADPRNSGEPSTRGYSETALAIPGLWVDADLKGPAHKAINLPPTMEAAWALLTEFPFAPTIVIDSGHGLQAWWLFRELWTLETAAERQTAQALARCFIATIQANAAAHGWQVDPTHDLARVLRVPGTWNRKLEPVPVRVIEYNETCRYNPSDFEPYLIEISDSSQTTRPPWRGPSGAMAPVLRYCRFIQHCRNHAATLSEPEWYSMVSNLARLTGGREAVHELSKPYPRYSPEETDKKIDHALKAAGPHTCAYIKQCLGFAGCPPGGCGVRAPAGLGTSRRAVRIAEAREQHATALELTKRLRQEAEEAARQALVNKKVIPRLCRGTPRV
jgi:putative DNA primase/helicase